MKNRFRTVSSGFTLIEMLVALAILSLLALLASNAFDGSRTKAQAMIALGKQVGDANLQLKIDTGCYVNNPKALFDIDAGRTAANNYCNREFKNTWARPYLAQYTLAADGRKLLVDKISADVTVDFGREVGGMGGNGKRYFVRFENIPGDVLKQALLECNNTDEHNGDFNTNRCRTPDKDAETGTFDILFDTTR